MQQQIHVKHLLEEGSWSQTEINILTEAGYSGGAASASGGLTTQED